VESICSGNFCRGRRIGRKTNLEMIELCNWELAVRKRTEKKGERSQIRKGRTEIDRSLRWKGKPRKRR